MVSESYHSLSLFLRLSSPTHCHISSGNSNVFLSWFICLLLCFLLGLLLTHNSLAGGILHSCCQLPPLRTDPPFFPDSGPQASISDMSPRTTVSPSVLFWILPVVRISLVLSCLLIWLCLGSRTCISLGCWASGRLPGISSCGRPHPAQGSLLCFPVSWALRLLLVLEPSLNLSYQIKYVAPVGDSLHFLWKQKFQLAWHMPQKGESCCDIPIFQNVLLL